MDRCADTEKNRYRPPREGLAAVRDPSTSFAVAHFVRDDKKTRRSQFVIPARGCRARNPDSEDRQLMAKTIGSIAIALLLFAAPAGAVCTKTGTVTSSSTQIAPANDINGIEGRHYMLIQNTGTSNPMNVAIGSSNAAATSDLYLGPGASWVMTMQGLKMVPGGDVAAISTAGTTYSFCDW